MRDGWRVAHVSDLVTEAPSAEAAEPWEHELLTVRLHAKGLVASGKKPNQTRGGRKHYFRRTGDILIGRQNYHRQCIGVVTPELDGYVTSNAISAFRAKEGVDPSFAYLVLSSAQMAAAADELMPGTGQREISVRTLRALQVALPPLDEQRRIVDLIAAVDDAVDAAEAEAVASELAARAYRRGAMSVIPTKCRIADVARIVTGRTFKAEHQGHATGVVPYFRVSDMTLPGNERELVSPADWLDEDGVTAVKPVICPPGTVVFPILGAALATEKRRVLGIEAGFVQHMIGLVPGPRVSTGWLLAVMSEVRLADISQKGAMPSVNQSLVGSIEMPLPGVDVQDQIVSDIAAMTGAADAARATAESLRTLRSNLLTVLLSGEHEIPSSYDALLGEVA